MREVPLVMPKMSMTMTEGTFLLWRKQTGDTVRNGDVVCEVASDKVDMEVESPVDGTLGRLVAEPDDVIAVGEPLAYISTDSDDLLGGLFDAEPTTETTPAAADVGVLEPAGVAAGATAAVPRATPPSRRGPQPAVPFARRRASELQLDLRTVIGSGPGGVVTVSDVETAAQTRTAATAPTAAPVLAPTEASTPAPTEASTPAPTEASTPAPTEAATSPFGPTEVVALSRIARVAGPALTRSWTTIPHVTHHDSADITELDAFRREIDAGTDGHRVTLLAFIMVAVARALREYPRVNSSLSADEKSLVLKRFCRLGVAVDTDDGLVVPVIGDADRKGVLELSGDLTDVSTRARAGTLTGDDLSGATFTISSLGGIGGTGFTPIVNGSEVAILGVSRAAMQPVWDGSQFVPRLMLPLSLSYDHRVIDGALAARFTAHLARSLGDARRLVL
ncbi:2-oxo acid dehydrogenase subunit E2 [Williamsia sp. CHRR-6]|uniref:2-oxo acid dehydrogenase subunit E2 n=1 Tax=Williamsia sp. CHRR-6 TaxID=2835871 RepID=UPI001BDAAB45|nr:2-oxo acid dehydrogenase subunit E2 [Williamsia sp. CHRR-6]MBT0566046.1 2-oxo acid dehydrogenase subunit E2 [Williamsia sp. CHRR-6]